MTFPVHSMPLKTEYSHNSVDGIHNAGKTGKATAEPLWGDDGFTFGDILETLNPLRHLPVVSEYYEKAVSDTSSEGAKIVGDALWGGALGGFLGLVGAVANTFVRRQTGREMDEHFLAMIQGRPEERNDTARNALAHQQVTQNKVSVVYSENPAFRQVHDWGSV